MEVSITVLGEIRISLDGVEARLERRHRILLAALVVEANLVETARLATYLWPDEKLPGDPAGQVQGYISRIRGALKSAAPGGEGLLSTVPGIGYRLRFERQSVDYYRFHRFKQEADGLFETNPAAGVTVARKGLSQWRNASGVRGGVLFEDMPQLERKAEAFRQEYQALLIACLAAELRCGRHNQVLPELVHLSEYDDYGTEHEELARLRMLAHYRAGQKSDALAVYDRLSAVLTTKFGCDPVKETRALKYKIAQDAPELRAPEPVAAEPADGATTDEKPAGPPEGAPATVTDAVREPASSTASDTGSKFSFGTVTTNGPTVFGDHGTASTGGTDR